MKNDRLDYIDVSKFVLMIFVVIGHCSYMNYTILKLIYSFHMPAFIIISGYFLKPKPFKSMVEKDFKSILLPYLVVIGISDILYLCQTLLFGGKLTLVTSCNNLLISNIFIFERARIIWFLLALFIAKTIFNYIIKFKFHAIYIVLITLLGVFSTKIICLPFNIQPSCMVLLYLYIGYLFKKYSVFDRFKKWTVIVCVLIWLISSCSLGMFIIAYNQYPSLIANICVSILGSYAVIMIVKSIVYKFSDKKIIKYLTKLGKYSLIMLCCHAIENYFIDWNTAFNFVNNGTIKCYIIIFSELIITIIPSIILCYRDNKNSLI